jgi:catalase (peroxidase I)
MPDPAKSCDGLDSIFIAHIYKGDPDAWALTAAISGAHTLGGASVENSGFSGTWSDAINQGKFNNDYYKSILHKAWAPELNLGGNPNKNQWKRVDLGTSASHKEMMLDTDMCLAYDNNIAYSNCIRNRGQNCDSFLPGS